MSASSYAGTIHPKTPDEKHVEYGNQFPFIARMCVQGNDASKQWAASAVLIAPHWALTAAHVTNTATSVFIVSETHKKPIKVLTIIQHEDYSASKSGYADISLCYIEEDFGLKFYPALYTAHNESGKICSIAGYGITGNFARGMFNEKDQPPIVRRGGTNRIDECSAGVLFCSPSNKNRTELEFLICPGDSGGGLFIDNKLAGINSFIMYYGNDRPMAAYGTSAGHTRVSAYVAWIKQHMVQYELELQARGTTGTSLKLKLQH